MQFATCNGGGARMWLWWLIGCDEPGGGRGGRGVPRDELSLCQCAAEFSDASYRYEIEFDPYEECDHDEFDAAADCVRGGVDAGYVDVVCVCACVDLGEPC